MKYLSAASGAVILMVFAVTFMVTAIDSIGTDFSDPLIALLVANVASVVAAIVVLVWAVPVHFLLKRLNKTSVLWYVFAAVIPCIVFIYGFKPFGQDTTKDLLLQTGFCFLAGGLGAVAFWYIAVHRQRITNCSN